MGPAIETHDLSKRYGGVTAVGALSLQVNPGEIYAFLGLNGAGKTTTIRMLLGMVRPTAGEVQVLGKWIKSRDPAPWGSVGYLVETANAYPELTVYENLEVMRRLRPGTPPEATSEIIDKVSLTDYADRRTGTLSHGNAQRLGLAKALLHNPSLLILDEPANGLDPAGIVDIRTLLISLVKDRGVTVFISSHILGEVARLANRIGIIHRGRLLQELDRADLQRKRRKRLLVRTRDNRSACILLHSAGFAAELLPDDLIQVPDEAAISQPEEIATRLVLAGMPPTMLTVDEEDLEHYFLRLIGSDQGDAV